MLPRLGPRGAGQEEAAAGPGLSPGSGEEEPGRGSPQPQAPGPPQTPAPPAPPSGLQAPVPLPPQGSSPGTASGATPLPPRDPGREAGARPQLTGPSRGSCRTLCHPSWPMYDAWGRAPTSGRPEEPVCGDAAGLPVLSHADVFMLDPLLPCGLRVPLYLSKPPHQALGPRRLPLPPPIMSCSVRPSSSRARPSTWLSEAEMMALTGLLQMSQGEPRAPSSAGPPTSTRRPDPGSASQDPGPSGGQGCSWKP